MDEALIRRFRDRLFDVARERYGRAVRGFGDGNAEIVRTELHALAGEASLLGEMSLASAASDGESAAQGWRSGDGADGDRARIGEALDHLAELLAAEGDGVTPRR